MNGWILTVVLAVAGEHHSGIPVDAVPVLGDAVFLETGWQAPILDNEGGAVRVFVADDEAVTVRWWRAELRQFGSAPPLPLGAEEAVGNGHSLAAFRDGNVAAVVTRPGGGAGDLAGRLLELVEDNVPWPQAPMVHVEGGTHVSVGGMWAGVAFRPAPTVDPKTFMPRPVRVMPTGPNGAVLGDAAPRLTVVVWDRYGRTATSQWERTDVQAATGSQK